MHVTFSEAELAFREEVRAFFRDEMPDDIQARRMDAGAELEPEMQIRWQKILFHKGWAGVNWPVEYGGTGWSPVQKYIFATEEGQRQRTARHSHSACAWSARSSTPIGNDEQKARFLPDILASNVWWCQGYSEPGAGSDLASLKTRADLAGDHYVVNGTKTWTTLGQHADWIFCLVRTSTDVARRQEGISFLLIDMKTPGVTVTPIILLDGAHEVNEVHFENVKVPVENLVGEEGKGWTYGKVLLQHERTNIGGHVARSEYRSAQACANRPTAPFVAPHRWPMTGTSCANSPPSRSTSRRWNTRSCARWPRLHPARRRARSRRSSRSRAPKFSRPSTN